MAQTTTAMTSKHATVEVSADNAGPWTDIGGSVRTFNVSGGDHKTGESNTFGAHIPVTGIGKRNAVTIAMEVIYTETASEAYDLMYGYFETQDYFWIRATPDGVTDNYLFKGRVQVAACPPPPIDANSADILISEVTLFGNEVEWQGTST